MTKEYNREWNKAGEYGSYAISLFSFIHRAWLGALGFLAVGLVFRSKTGLESA